MDQQRSKSARKSMTGQHWRCWSSPKSDCQVSDYPENQPSEPIRHSALFDFIPVMQGKLFSIINIDVQFKRAILYKIYKIYLFLVTSFNSLRPQGRVSEGIGTKLKSICICGYFIFFFVSRCEREITRAVCARDVRGISAPVTSPTFLSDSRLAGVTWRRFSILQENKKTTLWYVVLVIRTLKLFPWGVSLWVFFLTLFSSSCHAFWMRPVWLWWMQVCLWAACSVEWPVPSTKTGKS